MTCEHDLSPVTCKIPAEKVAEKWCVNLWGCIYFQVEMSANDQSLFHVELLQWF